VFWAVIIFVNIFGTLGFAEEEFWAACFKLAAIIIFMIVAIVLICGGGPSDGIYDEYWGARLWYDPGAFQNGFRGFCSVFVTAAFSYAGTELVGLTAAEAKDPLKGGWSSIVREWTVVLTEKIALPSAIKQVFWRITL
jgi:amino acid transporter